MPLMPTISIHRPLVILCSLLLLLAASCTTAHASNDTGYTISGSLLHFDYQEFSDTGKLLDRETGYIPGLVLGLNKAAGQWLFAGDFSYHRGDTPYTGYTNSGIPITTTTRQNIADIALRAEYWPQTGSEPPYAIYLGAAWRQWQRDILSTTTASGAPVGGLYEIYKWWTGFMGIKGEVFSSADNRLILDIRLQQTFKPTIHVDFHGTYDSANLPLGERLGARLALPWQHKLSGMTTLAIEPYAEYYEFGRSATAPLSKNGSVVGNVYEPLSQTLNYGLTVGVNQRF